MKFIHTSDIHYGMNPDIGKPWSKERADAIKLSLQNIVNACKAYDVDCLFISGDLFHKQALLKDLKEINYLFSSISKVQIFIIAGNHDYIKKDSYIPNFAWSKNVHYITSKEISSVFIEDLNTEVYGFSYYSKEINESLINNLAIPDADKINILMLHGGDLKHLPFNKNELLKYNFTYYALGHIHKHSILFDNMVYPGSPEPLDCNELGIHGFILGEIDDEQKKVTKLDFISCASAAYICLTFNISIDTTNTELLLKIGNEINKRGLNNIYKIKISGLRDPDIDFDLDILLNRFKIIEITDESEPNYDFNKLYIEHASDMLGFFINELKDNKADPITKKALFYGTNALLKTSDERN